MTNGKDADDRLADLESRFAHTDLAFQDLSDVTREQWDEIDRLKRQVERLKDRIAELEQGVGGTPRLEDQKPPHY
mgnify:FL=1